MYCTNCGNDRPDNQQPCPNCGTVPTKVPPPAQQFGGQYTPPPVPPAGAYRPGSGIGTGEQIPNYLVQSILVTLCCCLPLGVVAIIFAAQVNSKLAAGDVAGAREASSKAKLFCWIALGLGLVGIVISFLVNGAAILSAIQANQ